jgi:hypothetical protein
VPLDDREGQGGRKHSEDKSKKAFCGWKNTSSASQDRNKKTKSATQTLIEWTGGKSKDEVVVTIPSHLHRCPVTKKFPFAVLMAKSGTLAFTTTKKERRPESQEQKSCQKL